MAVGMTVSVGMAVTAVAVDHALPAGTGNLIHPFIGNDHIHIKVRFHQRRQFLLVKQINGHLAGSARMMVGQLCPTHAVGNGQLSTGFYQFSQHLDQVGRIGEMRESIVDHDGIKFFRELHGLHIAADHLHIGEFALGDLHHFRGNIDARHRSDLPAQIIGKQHTGSAGHIQHMDALFNAAVIQNHCDQIFIADHILIPPGGAFVKKSNDVFLFHSLLLCFTICRYYIPIFPFTQPPWGE